MKTKITIGLIVSICIIPFIGQNVYAHGGISAADCTKPNMEYNTFLYKEDINGINDATRLYMEEHPHASMKELIWYLRTVYVYLKQPVELAHCINGLGTNPSSVAQLSPLAWNALTWDKQELEGFAPDFLEEIPAPIQKT